MIRSQTGHREDRGDLAAMREAHFTMCCIFRHAQAPVK